MKLTDYELEVIIGCINQCNEEFGLATRDKEAFNDLKEGKSKLREYNGRVFLDVVELINKIKLLSKPSTTTNEQPKLSKEDKLILEAVYRYRRGIRTSDDMKEDIILIIDDFK